MLCQARQKRYATIKTAYGLRFELGDRLPLVQEGKELERDNEKCGREDGQQDA